MKPLLKELNNLPEGLLDRDAHELADFLDGPTLLHLQGRNDSPLFVSVLMHGNETVGWEAIRRLLPRYEIAGGDKPLPRSLSLFIGNVAAAREGMRHLPGQPDYNRVWPGCNEKDFSDQFPDERQMMQQVVAIMEQRRVFASVDVHNNTGMNPHYACVNVIRDDFLHLATLFGRTVVYFTDPCQVASKAMARLCPSVTLECGKVGQQHGVEHAVDYLDACLHLQDFPKHPVASHDVDLFHTVATVKIPPHYSFGFEEQGVDVQFPMDLEYLNFRELAPGTYFGKVINTDDIPLSITDAQGRAVHDEYFSLQENELVLKTAVMPSMLTTDKMVIRQDCLCYLMERYQLP